MEIQDLSKVQAIGIMGIPDGAACFDHADMILQNQEGKIFCGRKWSLDGVTGHELTEEDFDGLVAASEAMRLEQPVSISERTVAWFLRPNFGDRQELVEEIQRANALLLHDTRADGWVLLVRADKVISIRADWSERALELCRVLSEGAAYPQAARMAQRAWLMALHVTPRIVAMLVYTMRLAGDTQRAESYRRIERNVHGREFDEAVSKELDNLKTETALPNPVSEDGASL